MAKQRRPMVWGVLNEAQPYVHISCKHGHTERMTLEHAKQLRDDLDRLLGRAEGRRKGLPETHIGAV